MRPFDHQLSGIASAESGASVYPCTEGYSALFNGADYLTFTPAAAQERRRWTLAFSVKIAGFAGDQTILATDSSSEGYITLSDGEGAYKLYVYLGGTSGRARAVGLRCDMTNHLHCVIVCDTTHADPTKRLRFFVNGKEQEVTSTNWPALDVQGVFGGGATHYIGRRDGGTWPLRSYLSNFHFIVGQALGPERFGGWSKVVSGLWVSKKLDISAIETPVRTSLFTGGTASASSGSGAVYAFDNNPSTTWQSTGTGSEYIQYEMPVGKAVKYYAVRTDATYGNVSGPSGWDLLGSNDGVSWDALDSRIETFWLKGLSREYRVSSPGSYKYYRLSCFGSVGSGAFTRVAEFEGYDSGAASYGANGSNPDFADAANLGKDASGNGNDWTVNGAPVQSGDVPWNNYVTFNPFTVYYPADLSNGNLTATGDGTGSRYQRGAFAIDGFNAYLEFENAGAPGASLVGLSECNDDRLGPIGAGSAYIYYHANGNIMVDGSLVATVSAWGDGDVISLAYNADTNEVQVRLNNALQGVYGVNSAAPLVPFVNARGTNSITLINGATGFTCTPPTGFKALCTANMPKPDVLDPSEGVAVVLRDGTGADTTVSGVPSDFVLTKDRFVVRSWCLQDRVRGPENCLFTDLPNAEGVKPGAITAFNADGYDLGSQSITNDLDSSYIDLCLKRGPEFGFDIVPYSGESVAGRQISHNCGGEPEMVWVKCIDGAGYSWRVYFKDIGPTKYLSLNGSAAALALSSIWNNTAPTSTHFTIGSNISVNESGKQYIAYLFRSVPGFSKVFSYEGNGINNGPFVDLGFTPLAVLHKNSDDTRPWVFHDTARNPHNPIGFELYPSESAGESQYDTRLLGLSSGFKIDSNNGPVNGTGHLHVGIAWAAQPFKYSNAF